MKKSVVSGQAVAGRVPVVDLLRGVAIAMMVAYHFCFDLNWFGVIHADLNHAPFWLGWRSVIVSCFLLVMGTSLWLAAGHGVRWDRFGRRLGLLAGAAAAVSLASWFAFPQSWIFFGVLHFIALASLLALPFLRLHWSNLIAGIALVGFGVGFSHPFFDQNAWQWFGLMTHKPVTEDYVPLLPWFGVVLIGLFLGRQLFGGAERPAFATWGSTNGLGRGLALAGRHALLVYLVHQPVLLGLLWLFVR